MYTPEVMERNLGMGNIGEAFFRWWYDGRVAQNCPGAVLEQYGFNPDGILVGHEKVEMLKGLRESPDYILISTEKQTKRAPIVGISVNGQTGYYNMHKATAPWLCHACARKVQQECYEKRVNNLWFNRYNITNDYRGFVEAYGVDVLLVTIVASWLPRVLKETKQAGLDKVVLDYIRHGLGGGDSALSKSVGERERLVGTLTRQNRGRSNRKYVLSWLSYKDILNGRIPYSIAGGKSQFGRPREVVCIDAAQARSEDMLIPMLRSTSSPT